MTRLIKPALAGLWLALAALTGCLPAAAPHKAPPSSNTLPATTTQPPSAGAATGQAGDPSPTPPATPASLPTQSAPMTLSTPAAGPAQPAAPDQPRQPRGYLTTPAELVEIAAKAAQGLEPYRSAVDAVLAEAGQPWDYRLDGQANCPNAEQPAWLDNDEGTPRLYARALAYHLTGKTRYAEEAAAILEQIMVNVLSVKPKVEQCRLNFGWGAPELVASADLLEGFWAGRTCNGPANATYGDTSLSQGPCKARFQNWLARVVYPLVSYSAERSTNNWGAAGTNTTAYIADYLWDRPELELVARPEQGELKLNPAQAYLRANQQALDRMNGYRVDTVSSSACDNLNGREQEKSHAPVKSQINELGIIPDDARRVQACNIAAYNGSYQNYPQLHLGHNIQQCELMLRRGDASCYDNVNLKAEPGYTFTDGQGRKHTTDLQAGRGSLERAIKAIIIDSHTPWRKDSSLEVAYRYYFNHHTLPGIEQWAAQLDRPAGCSQDICFGTLTHGFAQGESPADPLLWPAAFAAHLTGLPPRPLEWRFP